MAAIIKSQINQLTEVSREWQNAITGNKVRDSLKASLDNIQKYAEGVKANILSTGQKAINSLATIFAR